MEEGIILVRVATISNPNPIEPNRLYLADLIELTGIPRPSASVYFLQRPGSMFEYDMVCNQDLRTLYGRITKAGARAMHLTLEESDNLFNTLFGERDNEKSSKLLAELNKRVKQAGLKGDERVAESKGRRGRLFT